MPAQKKTRGLKSDRWRSALPPRKKDWKAGSVQLGLFIRDEKGRTVEFTANVAAPKECEAAYALLAALSAPR